MSDFTDTAVHRALSALLRGSITGGPWTAYVGVHKTDTAGTRAELSGSGYARQAVGFAAPSSRESANAATITVPTSSATPSSTEVGWLGIWDAVTSGTLMALVPMGVIAEYEATVDAATDTVSTGVTVHGFVATDRITFDSIDTTLPTGITAGVAYFVIASGLTTTAFKVSLTSGGSTIAITGSGGVVARKITPIITGPSALVEISAGALALTL